MSLYSTRFIEFGTADLGNVIQNKTTTSLHFPSNTINMNKKQIVYPQPCSIKESDIVSIMNGAPIYGDQTYTFGPMIQSRTVVVNNTTTSNTLAFSNDETNFYGLITTFAGNGQLTNAFFNGSMWVAITSDVSTNNIGYSYDGIKWTVQSVAIATGYISLCWFNNIWLAGGYNASGGTAASIIYSYDGINWTGISGTSALIPRVYSIQYNGHILLATGANVSNTSPYMAYSYDGFTWTASGTSLTSLLTGAIYKTVWNGSLWVAVGQGTNSLAYTTDPLGLSGWVGLSNGTVSSYIYDCVWNGTLFVAVGYLSPYSSTVYYSYNGISWVTTTNLFGASARSVAWNGKKFIVGGPNGSSSLAYSYDGIHWTSIINTLFSGSTNSISAKFNTSRPHSITFQRNMVIAGTSVGNTMAYSFDGINWTGINQTVFSGSMTTAAYNGRIWVIGSGSGSTGGNTLATSTNGLKWNGIGSTLFSQSCNSIVWSSTSSIWIAGGSGTNTLGYSYDGLTWIPTISPFTACYSLATYNGKFVAVGSSGSNNGNTIANSSDGINWSGLGTNILTNGGLGLATNGSIWIAVGQNTSSLGSIAYSTDTMNWIETNNSLFYTSANAVAWNGSIWVAVGSGNNSTAYSYDGLTWYAGTNIFAVSGTNIAWNGTIWIASGLSVAGSYSMAYSPDGINWYANSNSTFLYAYGIGSNYGVQPKPYIQHPTLAFGSLGTGTNTIAYSPDGVNWVGLGATIFSTAGRRGFWNGKMWVAVGQGTNSLAYSYDGVSWSGMGSDIFTQGIDVCYNGKIWVAVGQGSTNTIGYSLDGFKWRGVAGSASIFRTYASGVIWTGSVFLASGLGGNGLATSTNGINWTGVPSASSYATAGCLYSATNGALTVVPVFSSIGLIYTYDITCRTGWTAVSPSPFTASGSCVAWNGSIWVAGGSGTAGNLAYSTNGISWRNAYFPSTVLDICWTGSRFVAISATNTGYSTDGINWISQQSLFPTQGYGVKSNSGIGAFVAPSALNLNNYGISGTQTLDVVASDPYYQTGFDTVSISIAPTFSPIYSSNWNFKTSVANNSAGNAQPVTYIATGNVATAFINGNTVVSFLSGTGSIQFSNNIQVNALIVGGGGAGGYQDPNDFGGGGGGGAGAVGYGSLYMYSPQNYTVTVGVGGIAGTLGNILANGGYSSIIGSNVNEIAYGGGKGGTGIVNYKPGTNGGSGGGGNGDVTTNSGGSAIYGSGSLTYLGNLGGTGIFNSNGANGGGGGGASSVGQSGINVTSTGIGGNGYTWGYTLTTYSGGGGGGASKLTNCLGGIGGTGGGGRGGNYISSIVGNGIAGMPNTGSGGGGGSTRGGNGGSGGSGIVSLAFQYSPTVLTPSTTGLGFYLTFNSFTIPATDAYSNALTINGNAAVIKDDIRGNVLITTSSNSSLSTTYATPTSFSRCFWYRPITFGLYNNTVSTLSLPLAYNGTGLLNALFNYPSSPIAIIDNYPRGLYSWNHYALTYNASTTTATLYTNGYQVATNNTITYNGDGGSINNGGLCIGDYNNTGQGAIASYDRIRAYNRVLTSLEVATIYNNEYVVPVIPTTGLTFSLSFTSSVIPTTDDYGSSITANGQVYMINSTRGYVVDMSGNTVSLSTNYATPATFTRAFWYNPLVIGGQMNTVSSKNLKMYFNNTNYLTATFNVVSGTPVSLTDTTARGANTWTHYALTYNGYAAILYVNGTQVVQNTSVIYTGEQGNLNAGGLCIGDYNATSAGSNSQSLFDKIHGYNTALSASQIATIYNYEYISSGMTFSLGFGSSTVPITDFYGTPVVNVGAVTMSNDIQAGYVAYMSGSNTSFSTTLPTTSSFSRGFWYKPTAIIGTMNTLSSKNLQMFFNSTNYMTATFNVVSGTPVSIADTVARGANTWTHYFLTYDSATTTARLYVNGAQVAQNTSITYTGEAGSLDNGGLCIGDYNATGFGIKSYFTNIRVYSRAITALEVLNAYNAEYIAPAFSTSGLTFSLAFGSASVPTTDSYGNALTNNNALVMYNDNTRGYVAYMSAINKSFSTAYATTASFSRTFWYLPTTITGAMNTVSSKNLKMFFNSTNFMTAAFNVVSGTPVSLADTTNRGTTLWTHYALTYNATTKTATLYANGAQVAQNTNVTYAGETGTLNNGGLCIGDYNATGVGSVSYFDQIHCYTRELSSVEVSLLYNYEYIAFAGSITSNATTTTTSGGYNILVFLTSGNVVLNSMPARTLYYLSVAGGGGAMGGNSGGGGGGGVLQGSLYYPPGSDTITITVGNGGPNVQNGFGGNTSLTFLNNTSLNQLSIGGGCGLSNTGSGKGGSGGGGIDGSSIGGAGIPGQGNNGGDFFSNSKGTSTGGGGGAGSVGQSASSQSGGGGGNGVLCTQPGISSYYPTYYWGGGGGGRFANFGTGTGNGGTGGLGGGGGGGADSLGNRPGGAGLNNGGSSNGVSGGSGGANTGGGGGAGTQSGTGGSGGSGIVVLAYNNVSPTPPTYSNFNLSFTSTTIPTVDLCGNQLVTVGNVSIVKDSIRGNVAYMASASQSFSTNYGTPSTFTRAFWYNPVNVSGQMNTVSSKNLKMHFNNTNYLTASFNVVSGTPVSLTDTTFRGYNAWTHYALTYSGTTATLYVNGSQIATNASVTYTSESPNLNAGALCIGDYNATGIGTTSGAYFDKIYNFNTAYSSAQILALYNAEYIASPVPTNGLTFSLGFASGIVPTADIYNTSLTKRGNVTISKDIVRGNVLYMPDINSSLFATYSTPTSFSRCFWYNITSGSYGTNPSNVLSSANLPIWFGNPATNLLRASFNFTTTPVLVTDTSARGSATWVHYAVTYSGTTATLYVNGVSIATATVTYTGDTTLAIGDYTTTGGGAIAYIDLIHCYNRALTSTEVTSIYNTEYISGYNVNNSNIINYYPFDTNLSDYKTGSAVSNVTSIGGAAIVTTNTKLTSGSLYLNSTSSQAVQIPAITLTSNGFTFAFWVKYISGGNWVRFFDFANGPGVDNFVLGITGGRVGVAVYNPSTGNTDTGSATAYTMPTDQNWHHICLTISSSSVWKLYADGVAYTLSNNGYPSANTLNNCYIGKSAWTIDPYPTMYLNQVVIYNRELTSFEIGRLVNYPTQVSFTSAASS